VKSSVVQPDYIKSPAFRRGVSSGYPQSSSDRTLSLGQGRLPDKIDDQAEDDAGRTLLKIHAIQTGTVRVKVCQRVGRGSGFMRQVNILLVYLPAHDPESEHRLVNRITVRVSQDVTA
jgi:hypothetical protein